MQPFAKLWTFFSLTLPNTLKTKYTSYFPRKPIDIPITVDTERATTMRVIVFLDANLSWRWHIKARNNKVVATSGESFDSKRNARRAAVNFVDNLCKSMEVCTLEFVEEA